MQPPIAHVKKVTRGDSPSLSALAARALSSPSRWSLPYDLTASPLASPTADLGGPAPLDAGRHV